MNMKSLPVIILVVLMIFAFLSPAGAIDTRAIEEVRAKKVLDNDDLQIIDAFVDQAVSEILNTDDFSSVSNIRSGILANSASKQTGQAQYAGQFSESAKKRISAALQSAEGLTPRSRSFKVITNLLMLVNDLADIHLIDLSLKYVDSNNSVISYWAVKCLVNPKITEKLNSPEESDKARQISGRLEQAVATGSPQTLGLIAAFASSLAISDGQDLLIEVADRRIASYADWSVQDELLDASILQMLANKMASSNPGRAAAGRKFAQLLSYVFQRYIKVDNLLNASQKQQLLSILVETEKSCLSKLLGKSSSDIKKAIESADLDALLRIHNDLLGDATKPGRLAEEIGFDYGNDGNDGSGEVLTHPLALADPPKSLRSDEQNQ